MAAITGYICVIIQIFQIELLSATSDLNIVENFVEHLDDIPKLHDKIENLAKNGGLRKYKLGDNNEDKYLNATQLMEKYGYKTEIHHVTTEDGYKPSMYRIPKKGEPVLIMHGMGSSAVDFLTVGPNNALPYLLANESYDVWMGNARGSTKDASGHEYLSAEKDVAQYWNYSWDEIGRYDLPAMINYILNKTGWPKLKFVGHSQGITAFFVLCSERLEYNDKFSMSVGLSAIAWASHMKSPLFRLLAPAVAPLSEVIRNVIGFHKITPNNPIIKILVNKMCGNYELAALICQNLAFIIGGFDFAQMNITNLPNIFSHTPGGLATKQLLHYVQEVKSGRFCRYDYGTIKNLEIYGSAEPPEYEVEKIRAPIAIFYRRDSDWLVGNKDLNKLRSKLPNLVAFIEVRHKNFCHSDFLWAKEVKDLVYDRILKLFKKRV